MTHSEVPGKHGPLDLEPIVQESLDRLKDVDEKVQKKGVKIFAALARTGKYIFLVQCDMTNELVKRLVRRLYYRT